MKEIKVSIRTDRVRGKKMTMGFVLFLVVLAAVHITEATKHTGQPTSSPLQRSTLVNHQTTGGSDLCYLPGNVRGHCVHFYLCDEKGFIKTDGDDLTDERTLDCEAPKLCCKLKDEVTEKPTSKPSTLVPVTPAPGPGSQCTAADDSSGRCLYPHLCTNDTTVVDGSDLLSERALDPCPSWRGSIQICCPAKYLDGKIDETTTPSSNDRDPKKVVPCSTRYSGLGSCVPVYQCVDDDDDGAGILNVRYDPNNQCSDDQTCCPIEKVDTNKTKPEENWKCGVGVPIANIHQKPDETKVRFGRFPWMATVRTRSGPGEDSFNISGGSIIHPSVILTVAHYVVRAIDKDVWVIVGEGDNRKITDERFPRQTRAVKTILPHPEFNNRNKHNDIALLILASPLQLAPHVRPICLPPPAREVPPSTDCVATGWGQDRFGREGHTADTLKEIILPIVDHADCQTSLRTTRLGPFFKLHEGFLCAGGGRRDTCTQDGGGPLACPMEDDPTRYIVSGVVSWGIGCGEDGVPGVYMSAAHYRAWVTRTAEEQGIKLDQS